MELAIKVKIMGIFGVSEKFYIFKTKLLQFGLCFFFLTANNVYRFIQSSLYYILLYKSNYELFFITNPYYT